MEFFSVIITIIAFVWGILNIILFFKIWGMVNDVREMKEYFLNKGSQNELERNVNSSMTQNNVELFQTTTVQVNWNHKFNIGDTVKYKENGNTLRIAQILETEYQYKCVNLKTGTLLSAIFNENELY